VSDWTSLAGGCNFNKVMATTCSQTSQFTLVGSQIAGVAGEGNRCGPACPPVPRGRCAWPRTCGCAPEPTHQVVAAASEACASRLNSRAPHPYMSHAGHHGPV